jgi:hypothetical protein
MRPLTVFLLFSFALRIIAHAQSGEYRIVEINPKGRTFSATQNGQVQSFHVRPFMETTINGLRATFEELDPGMK